MFQTITTALSALAGGFIGAYFTRQAQHHKWLLEKRAESFATFLQMLDEARGLATELLYNDALSKSKLDRDIKITEAYTPVLNYARIVKLYLPKTLRKEFYDSAKAYWALHTDPDLGDQRLKKMDDYLNQIQGIFEQELSAYFWLFPVLRKFKHIKDRTRSEACQSENRVK